MTEVMDLTEKLRNIQNELKAPKDKYNSFGNYKYRNAESILEALKPLEIKYSVLTTLTDEVILIGSRYYVKSIATIIDCENAVDRHISAVAYAREEESKKGMDAAQITGACSSYARKSALSALLLLDDSNDVDSEEYQVYEKKAPKTEKKAEPKKQDEPVKADNGPDYRAELRKFVKANGIDPKTIVAECNLKPSSSNEEWKKALEYADKKLREQSRQEYLNQLVDEQQKPSQMPS